LKEKNNSLHNIRPFLDSCVSKFNEITVDDELGVDE
jgi:hypothetical protein